MRKRALWAVVVLTALLCALPLGDALLTAWARRVALEHLENGYLPTKCSAYVQRTGWQQQGQLQIALAEWRAIPWYGDKFQWTRFGALRQRERYWRWIPARAHYEMLKLITGEDLGMDPAAWESWAARDPGPVWVPGLNRIVKPADLAALLHDPRQDVRVGALDAVQASGRKDLLPEVLLLVDDSESTCRVSMRAMQVLTRWDETATAPAIAKNLTGPRLLVKLVAADCVSRMGYRPALPALAALLEDEPGTLPSKELKEAAARAVGRLNGEAPRERDSYTLEQARAWWAAHRGEFP